MIRFAINDTLSPVESERHNSLIRRQCGSYVDCMDDWMTMCSIRTLCVFCVHDALEIRKTNSSAHRITKEESK